ncbi:MAG: phosphoadenosine phosphosulfate reductase [Burkholderiaceae bacterium]|nr:MAG: phosphoadenosine phosphosulfate reductase [Burkholderiaceae bacterium]TBR76866.1 MAG: phosphoadenosine phosphosulfate reductase [Burkholderiaceae bacterium]
MDAATQIISRQVTGDLAPSVTPIGLTRSEFANALSPDLSAYDRIVVFFSGGKDSVACVLHLLDQGVPASKLELHHHLVDGEHKPGETGLMDWPVTNAYCEAFAKHFGAAYVTSWRTGGIEREMLRQDKRTAPVVFYRDGQRISVGGTHGPLGTRRRFPQLSASLSTRWCSSSVKIDVGAAYLRNDPKFRSQRTLVVTGERAQESSARARYAAFEPHRADNRRGASLRHIDHWRPVHSWSEKQVWAIIERHRIQPHYAYEIGWGRVSCQKCIFGSKNQWATVRQIDPAGFAKIAAYEKDFDVTINRKLPVGTLADQGTPYEGADGPWVALAMSTTFEGPIVVDNWTLPAGAFGESCGPT